MFESQKAALEASWTMRIKSDAAKIITIGETGEGCHLRPIPPLDFFDMCLAFSEVLCFEIIMRPIFHETRFRRDTFETKAFVDVIGGAVITGA